MNKKNASNSATQLIVYWLIVGLPLAWGVWKTLVKLPALLQ
jgi:hypothetical protein